MSKRKTPSSNTNNYHPAPVSASDSVPDLNLDILLLSTTTSPPAAKKLKSSSEAAVPSMDARVPDRDLPDDDDDSPATSDSSSDLINTEEDQPFPRNSCSFKYTTVAPAASALVFDILRREGRRSPVAPPLPCNIPTTHQLFPESSAAASCGGASEHKLLVATAAEPANQWLKLSEAESTAGASAGGGGGGEAPAPPQQAVQPRKSRRGPRSRSSQFRGVTFYRRTGRWESHIWDCGKQVYLGGFDTAHAAARAYDRAAIKFRGVGADINFTLGDYDEDMKATKDLSKEEFVHVLRRQNTGFSRGSSKYRGVSLHKCGRWEARMGQLLGNKYIYLGLFESEVEAARAYDKAAIEYGGTITLTNFQQREFDTNTSEREDDLDLRLGMSPNSKHDGRKNSTLMEARVRLVDNHMTTPTSVEGPSSSRAGPPFGFQPLHGLPINIASNNFSTWPPPPSSPSTFDRPEMRGGGGGGQTSIVVQGGSNNGSSNIPFLATTTTAGGFASSSWAHHQQLTGVASGDDVNGVPKWSWPSSSSPQQIAAAASSGFVSSSSSNNMNRRENAGGSSSSSPSVNPFQSSNQYWYSH